jgi:hypothetical protein
LAFTGQRKQRAEEQQRPRSPVAALARAVAIGTCIVGCARRMTSSTLVNRCGGSGNGVERGRTAAISGAPATDIFASALL